MFGSENSDFSPLENIKLALKKEKQWDFNVIFAIEPKMADTTSTLS